MVSGHEMFVRLDKNAKLWRYMDFAKFMTILEKETIFFVRSDRFEDKHEGSYPTKNIEMRKKKYGLYANSENFLEKLSSLNEEVRRCTFINCWHMNDIESMAMWGLYTNSSESVAIQTTTERLENALENNDEHIDIGKVAYIDYNENIISEKNTLNCFFHKRCEFAHEKEARAIFQKVYIDGKTISLHKILHDYGVDIKVDVSKLIEKIYVAPNAPIWFFELVKLIIEKNELDVPVILSGTRAIPKF